MQSATSQCSVAIPMIGRQRLLSQCIYLAKIDVLHLLRVFSGNRLRTFGGTAHMFLGYVLSQVILASNRNQDNELLRQGERGKLGEV